MKRHLCRLLVACCVILSVSGGMSAQDILYDSLKNGLSVRALSMGNAYTGLAEEGAALFYNPAGLAIPGNLYAFNTLDQNNAIYNPFSMHAFYFAPFGITTWQKQDLKGNNVEVTAYGYGRRSRRGVDWGVTYKTIRQTGTTTASGWSADLGILAHLTPNINFGFTAKDVFKNDVSIPATFVTGLAMFSKERDFILTTDLVHSRENGKSEYYGHYGAEAMLGDGFLLRGGYFQKKLTGGVSFILPFVELDYGIVAPQDGNGSTMYMIGAKFGRGVATHVFRKRYALFKPRQYAEFRLSGQLVGGQSDISLFGGQKIGTNDLLTLIHHAAEDRACKGFFIRVGTLNSSITAVSVVQEIRNALLRAQRKGKSVIVYIENWAALPEYYLASMADKIIMPELGTISHLGLDIEVIKTKKFFNKFGIDTEIVATGRHKASLDPNSDTLSTKDRDILEDLIGGLYNQVLFDIKRDRDLDWAQVRDVLLDGRLISAREAKEKGLVDELGYWEKALSYADNVKKNASDGDLGVATVPLSDFYDAPEGPSIFSAFNRIAVVEIDGVIVPGSGGNNVLFGGRYTGAEDIGRILKEIRQDITIRGVILRVNSPGGSLVASDQIYEDVKKLMKAGKPVYTSMGNMATSGGYYVSMHTDKIFANRGTLTGSIGVVSRYQNMAGLNSMLGIEREVVKTGKYMDMMSSGRALTEDEKAMLQAYQQDSYQVFVDKVRESRDISEEEAEEIAQGQVFTGEKAVDLKLVDELGDFYDTVDQLSKDVKIKSPELIYYRRPLSPIFSFLGQLFGRR